MSDFAFGESGAVEGWLLVCWSRGRLDDGRCVDVSRRMEACAGARVDQRWQATVENMVRSVCDIDA